MNNSLISAAVSMNSMQSKLNLIADNVANMDTIGYKRKENSFEDVLTRVQSHLEDFRSTGRATPLGYNIGYGVKLASVTTNMEQGPIQDTGIPTDLAIQGNGLFAVKSNGNIAYTREGSFHFNPIKNDPDSMVLLNNEGDYVLNRSDQPIIVPANGKVAIDDEGNVWTTANGTSTRVLAGQVQFVEVQRPEGLVQMDGNKFVVADGVTNNDVFGNTKTVKSDNVSVLSGKLEKSNVDLTTEMTDMVQVQRAYQLMARSLTSSDNMMGLANNLRG